MDLIYDVPKLSNTMFPVALCLCFVWLAAITAPQKAPSAHVSLSFLTEAWFVILKFRSVKQTGWNMWYTEMPIQTCSKFSILKLFLKKDIIKHIRSCGRFNDMIPWRNGCVLSLPFMCDILFPFQSGVVVLIFTTGKTHPIFYTVPTRPRASNDFEKGTSNSTCCVQTYHEQLTHLSHLYVCQ